MTPARLPVLVDTDMGTDDWLALLYLLQHPAVQVSAITVTGAGLAHAAPGGRIALQITDLLGQPDIPVAVGRDRPVQGNHEFPAEWRSGADGLQGLQLPDSSRSFSPLSARDLILATAASASAPLHVLALGPLTNIAEALLASPALKRQISSIYYMGGAVDVEGNIASSNVGIDNRWAEWNIFCDPTAADIVFRSGIPLALIPLDATNLVPVTRNFHQRLLARRRTPAGALAADILTQYDRYLDTGEFCFWDPLAAAIMLDNSLAGFDLRRLAVIQAEGPDCGRLVPDPDRPEVRVATWADARRFEESFLDLMDEQSRLPASS